MLAFASLFLSLISGPQEIELLVGEGVVAVELRLDGQAIGALHAAPWKLRHDFGEWPEPHRLSAIAFDGERRPVAQIEQLVNLPRPEAEAQIVLTRGTDGARVARLAWDTSDGEQPERLLVTLDDVELVAPDPAHIPLPAHDPAVLHLPRAELAFESGLVVTAQATFGGFYFDRVETLLTAVPIALPTRRTPPLEELQGAFTAGGEPVRVLAVEKGPVDLLLVRDQSAHAHFQQLLRREMQSLRHNKTLTGKTTEQRLRQQLTPTSQARLQFVFPFEVDDGGAAGRRLFARSAEIDRSQGGLLWLLAQMQAPALPAERQQLADACAIAGRRAAARDRRRAVVLVLGPTPIERSRWRPEHARHYLRSIRVPLFVWATHPEAPGARGWGEVRDVSTAARLRSAYSELDALLESQRMVWIEGRQLPPGVAIDPSIAGSR